MQTEDFDFISIGETKIRGKIWLPNEEPKAILCIIHGLGEHSGRYDHFAKYFTSENIAVYAIDLRGHGLSESKRGHAAMADLLEDVQELIITARREYNDLPIFLFGQSMGGNILANYLIKNVNSEIRAAIFSSSWFKLVNPPNPLIEKSRNIFKGLFPFITLNKNLDINEIINDEKEQERYNADPLVHDKISLRLYFDIKKGGQAALKKANLIEIPILVCHGDKDQITSTDASKAFANNAGNAKFHLWVGERHEPHNDLNKEKVISYYVEWVKNQIKK